jgi:ribulose 1,5-bisphosphate synthetase/thiazole synthase
MGKVRKTWYEKSRELPVTYSADVIIAGGGSAGFAAALASARNNAKTILLEREYTLGGIMTSGLMAKSGP